MECIEMESKNVNGSDGSMQQYVVAYGGAWWHFFLNRSGALCFRRKEGARWSGYEILLPGIAPDFSVIAREDRIHIVCQDTDGRILYLQYGEEKWQKTVVYESGEGETAYPKYFFLTTVAGYLNLFYVLRYKGRPMLVHQIMGMGGTNMIGYITPSERPFCVVESAGTDLAVFFVNADGVLGLRKYLWSKKDFAAFVPIPLEAGLGVPHAIPAKDGYHLCGVVQVDGVDTVAYVRLGPSGEAKRTATLYLDAVEGCIPLLLDTREKLYVVWNEYNGIYYAASADDGASWDKAVRFIKNDTIPAVRYAVSSEQQQLLCYGYERDGDISLFLASALLEEAPSKRPPKREFQPAGRDVEQFAEESAHFTRYQMTRSEEPKSYITMQSIYAELCALKEQVTACMREASMLRDGLASLGALEAMVRQEADAMADLEARMSAMEAGPTGPAAPAPPEGE